MTKDQPISAAPGLRPAGEHSFASVNFLRGLSAFTVLFSHTANAVNGAQPIMGFNWGGLAVDVFMLISGFLMMFHFYERRLRGEAWGSSKTCLKFYTRRFFRIAPLYYCLLLVVYLFHDGLLHAQVETRDALHQAYPRGPHDPTSDDLSVAQVASHFTFLFGFFPQFAQSNPLPDWSIGLEMQFYLFFPFLALLLVRTQFLGGVVLMLAANGLALHLFGVGTFADPKLLGLFPYPSFLPLRLTCFLVGMLLAAGLYEKSNPAKRAFLLLLALLVAGLYMKKFLLICFGFAFYELAAAGGTGLPALDQSVKRLGGLMDNRLCQFAADASYGVYCIHIPLLIVLVQLLCVFFPFAQVAPLRRFLILLPLVIPIVYAIAFVTFKYIETPGIALGRKLVKRIG
jgi:peptidoglycan/LPS O-acetylase OafA/YrhL